jgi:hypothetical protein
VAIIIYRDFDYEASKQLEFMDFTEDLDAFKAFLEGPKAQAIHSKSPRRGEYIPLALPDR